MKLKFFLFTFCAIVFISESKAQTPQEIMNVIYQKYDSTPYLSFDVKYLYLTDTVAGDFKKETLDGSYTMAGNKAKYFLGDVEFMQNDSFLISVYNKEKFILVADPNSNGGNKLPLRNQIDDLFTLYSNNYTISSFIESGTGVIRFIRADSVATFDALKISYTDSTKLLSSIQYRYTENELTNPDDSTGSIPKYIPRSKALEIVFANYRLDNFSPDLYNENNYIWFEAGECKPVEKYRDYKIYYSRTN